MVRVTNEQDYAQRRNAILDTTQQLVESKGYEQMTIQDILDALHISKGAFYYYFDSKAAALFALIQRLGDQAEQLVLPIIHDPELSAPDKLQRFFDTLGQEKKAHKRFILEFMRIWYDDENALVRQKLYTARVKRFTPLLAEIIRQGNEEGVFQTSYPEQAGRWILALSEEVAFAAADLLLAREHRSTDLSQLEQMAEAWVDALERILGAKPGCFHFAARDELSQWQVSPGEPER